MSIEAISQMAKGVEKAKKPEKSQEELRQTLTEKAESLRASTLKQLDIYEDRLEKGEFEDQAGEPTGSGEKRKLQMQKELLIADARIDKIKEILNSGEELPQEPDLDIEAIKTQNQAFFRETFAEWYDEEKAKVEQIPIFADLKTQDYATLKDDIIPTKFGEYTLNPEMQSLDFENIPESKIIIPDLSSLNGKGLDEVAKYLIDNYADKYKIPGAEYWKWLVENPTKSPANLKDGNYYFEFGSLVRVSVGRWSVPCARWSGSEWRRSANWLDRTWNSSYRVVLLEI